MLTFVCWDLKPVFYAIWGPLTFLMGYSDPRKPTNDLLHGARTCCCVWFLCVYLRRVFA